MPAGRLVTVPAPVPARLIANVRVTAAAVLKVAVQLCAAFMATVAIAPEPAHEPDQPAKVEPLAGLAVNTTEVPSLNEAVQLEPQATPPGALVTVPVPVPERVTVSA
jgi:hypothetical protein